MAETIDFLAKRQVLRPNELPPLIQRTLYECAQDELKDVIVGDGSGIDRSFYIKDLARRMIKLFQERDGLIGQAAMKQFNDLSPDEQDQVQEAISSFKARRS